MQLDDHYKTLGIHPAATFDEIKARFQVLSRLHDPELFRGREHLQITESQFRKIREAYDVLCDPLSRTSYDRRRAQELARLQGGDVSSFLTACLWGITFLLAYLSACGFYISGYLLHRPEYPKFAIAGVITLAAIVVTVVLFRAGIARLRRSPNHLHLLFELPLVAVLPWACYSYFTLPAAPTRESLLGRAIGFSCVAYFAILYFRGNSLRNPSRSFWEALMRIFFGDIRLTLFGVCMVYVGMVSLYEDRKPKKPTKPYNSEQAPSDSSTERVTSPLYGSKFIRPVSAPNGQPWPVSAGYVSGYPQLGGGGYSSVTVDNGQNDSDVFLKLVSVGASEARPVRVCYIPAHSTFTFGDLAPGRYDVRYQDFSTGGFSKTEEFVLSETVTATGTEYSKLSLTLYKVENGNMQTESINASEF